MTPEEKAVFISALEKFGNDNQIFQLFEEMGELTVAINGYRRGRCTLEDVKEEIADVEIMLEQMKIIFNATEEDIEEHKQYKTTRLKERVHGKSI
jgi:NTP pyrophosphatase (non-canonical NTP hydrolase)